MGYFEKDNGTWRVVAEYIGEGYEGDYDENDPLDQPLMRFDLFRVGEDEAVDSYCTLIPETDTTAIRAMTQIFLNELGTRQRFPKHVIELLTWTTPEQAKAEEA
jgi:hypothetical protein